MRAGEAADRIQEGAWSVSWDLLNRSVAWRVREVPSGPVRRAVWDAVADRVSDPVREAAWDWMTQERGRHARG